MIAVFTKTDRDFEYLGLKPKKNFIRIKSIQDISGIVFTSAIFYLDFYNAGDKIIEAYNALEHRHPEIFK